MSVFGLLLAAGRGRRFDPDGRRSKLEALIDGEMVAVRTLHRFAAGCDRVVAVCRDDQVTLRQRLADAGALVVTLDRSTLARRGEGMGVSLAAGAVAIDALGPDRARDHLLVLPADMPWVRTTTIRRIAAASPDAVIVVPTFVDALPARQRPADRPGPSPAGPQAGKLARPGAVAQGAGPGPIESAGIEGPVLGGQAVEGHPVRFSTGLLDELAALSGDRGARVLFSRHDVLRLEVIDRGIIQDIDTPEDLASGPSS